MNVIDVIFIVLVALLAPLLWAMLADGIEPIEHYRALVEGLKQ